MDSKEEDQVIAQVDSNEQDISIVLEVQGNIRANHESDLVPAASDISHEKLSSNKSAASYQMMDSAEKAVILREECLKLGIDRERYVYIYI